MGWSWVIFEVRVGGDSHAHAWCLHDGVDPGFRAVTYIGLDGVSPVDFGVTQGAVPALRGAKVVAVLPAGERDSEGQPTFSDWAGAYDDTASRGEGGAGGPSEELALARYMPLAAVEPDRFVRLEPPDDEAR